MRDGSVQEQLTHNASNVMSFDWSVDGDRLYYKVGRPRESMRMELEREGKNGFLYDDRFIPMYDTVPLISESTHDKSSHLSRGADLWVFDLQHWEERRANDEDWADYIASSAGSGQPQIADERSAEHVVAYGELGMLAWLENENPQQFAGPRPPLVLHVSTPERGELRCSARECKGLLTNAIWSPDGQEIHFVRREGVNGLRRGFYAWNYSKNSVREVLRTDDWITKCQPAVGRLVCLHESPTTPRKIVAIDPTDGSITTLVEPNPEFQALEFTRVEKLEWRGASGAEAAGHLVYPEGYIEGQRYPLIIVQYQSRGFLRGGIGNEYPIHPLAANGFFVLSFDRPNKPGVGARIGDRYEREREDWGKDLWERSATLSALETMIDQLDQRGQIDPARVGITGLSDGAETVWYAMIHSTRFAAASASSGGWSPSWYYQTNGAMRENLLKRSAELQPPGMGGDDRWRRIAPEFHASKVDTPILVQVADHELLFSAATIGALMDAGKPIETYVYSDEYHVKWQPQHKLSVYERSIDWFNFWLRGVEDSSVNKVEQYDRWRKLQFVHIANLEAAGRLYSLPMSWNQ